MRLAWLVHQYPPDHLGGTELYTHGLARRALADGHEVLVVTYRESPSADRRDYAPIERHHEGVPVVELPYNLSIAPSRARYEYDNPELGRTVRAVLDRFRPDLVHCTHGMKLSASALDACSDLGVPFVLTLTDFWFLCPRHTLLTSDGELCRGPDRWRRCFRCTHALHGIERTRAEKTGVRERPAHLREVLGRARRVVSLSHFQREFFADFGLDPRRLEVIPAGLELDGLEAAPPPRPGPPTRLAVLGTLVQHKGAHVAIAALRARPELRDVELVVRGPARPDDPYLASLVRQSAEDERVKLAGPFQPAELWSVLGAADFLAVPALWYENDPIMVKAALHLGVPAIVSRIGSLVEMVEGDADGWAVEPGDVEAWGEAFAQAADRPRDVPRNPTPQPSMDDHYRSLSRIYAEEAA
jgi:glycosyltransferase involved in cell wall biosynthesis